MEQLPISAHGLIGDLRTAALVGSDGRIDWFCPGRFDASSIFAAILDTERGGYWRITPEDPAATTRQFYLPDTNVLVTRFSSDRGVVELEDLMVLLRAEDRGHRQRLVRRVRAIRGVLPMRVEVRPRFDYGRRRARGVRDGRGIRFPGESLDLMLVSSTNLELDAEGDVTASIVLHPGEDADMVLEVLEPGAQPGETVPVSDLVTATAGYWRSWLSRSTYRGRWREAVERSALTLKLLTHEPSGAIVAAPTTSLPESIGGERNWDYRHVWVRDAAFTVYALLRLGFLEEAAAFVNWLTDRIGGGDASDAGPLRVMYDLDGGSAAGEQVLEHLSGYRGSRPVRVRNDAAEQLQLDVYGELIDSAYLFDKYGSGLSYETWQDLVRVVDWLLENWDRPDQGIWETRAGPRPHTFSRVMSWVAMERMMRMARFRGRPGPFTRWQRARDEIIQQVFADHWSDERGAFVDAAGSTRLDAALLLMPAVKFLTPHDPRFRRTIEAIEASLVTDTLVFRYDTAEGADGLPGGEGTFSMCSFWYVEALTRVGRLDEARLAFEKMLTYGNPVGLFAEEVGIDSEQIGNFPQGFTHLSLISAAINLDRALQHGGR